MIQHKKIAVILPSRGLMFSRTAQEILDNLKPYNYKIFFSHRKPIPDCFEEPLTTALKDKDVARIWFVEDDMVLPPHILGDMLAMNKAVVTADYPINKDGRGAVTRDKGGKILFTGTGCLLVQREAFDELQPPYFRTDIRWNMKNMGDYVKITGAKISNIEGYGLHDVNFCMNLHKLNIPIHCIGTPLGQRKLVSLGKAGSNNGAHNIELWTKIKKDHLLKQVMKWPVSPVGNLTTVITPTGEISCTPEHAAKLIKAGLATKTPKRYSVIDFYEVDDEPSN